MTAVELLANELRDRLQPEMRVQWSDEDWRLVAADLIDEVAALTPGAARPAGRGATGWPRRCANTGMTAPPPAVCSPTTTPTEPLSAAMGNHRYGIRFMSTWPHISLGFSAHIDRKYGHLSLHLPIGVVIVGFTGQPAATEDRLALTEKTLTVASRAIDRRDDQLAAEKALCDRLAGAYRAGLLGPPRARLLAEYDALRATERET